MSYLFPLGSNHSSQIAVNWHIHSWILSTQHPPRLFSLFTGEVPVESYALLSISFRFFSIFFFSWKKREKKVCLMLMSLLLIPKFSLPAEQMESYSASRANFPHLAVLFLPSLKPAERISSTPDLEMDLLAWQAFPQCPFSVENNVHFIPSVLLSNISSRRAYSMVQTSSQHLCQDSCLSQRLLCHPPSLVLLFCRKLTAGPRKVG